MEQTVLDPTLDPTSAPVKETDTPTALEPTMAPIEEEPTMAPVVDEPTTGPTVLEPTMAPVAEEPVSEAVMRHDGCTLRLYLFIVCLHDTQLLLSLTLSLYQSNSDLITYS